MDDRVAERIPLGYYTVYQAADKLAISHWTVRSFARRYFRNYHKPQAEGELELVKEVQSLNKRGRRWNQ